MIDAITYTNPDCEYADIYYQDQVMPLPTAKRILMIQLKILYIDIELKQLNNEIEALKATL